MQKYLDNTINPNVAFVEDIKNLSSTKDLSSKKLCIIKTNFKDLNPLKQLRQKFPNTEFWLTSSDISRKNILQANYYGVKNVIPFPFDIKIIREFFQKKQQKSTEDKYTCEGYSWMKGLKIMIVDDNPMNIELLVETFASSGLNISTFQKPQNALDALMKEKFDLFLLDVMMPDISGFDLAQKIKESELNKDTPVIFISALSDPENKITGYDLGSCAYIEKPFDVNVVRSQVFNILKSRKLQLAMNSTKESFIAMVAHDLKSPVNAEITALELLLQKIPTQKDIENNEIITDLLQAAKYMKNLVDNILYKYKFETNNVSLNKDYFSLNSLITESVAEMKYLAADKKQLFVFKNTAKHYTVCIDYIEIKRVLHNLFSNAIEHAPRNSIIEVFLSENKFNLQIAVENTLKHLPPQNINDIFEKFVSFADKSKCVNSGLGLYVAKRIIEAHKGTIKAEIKNNNKIRFTIQMPKETSKSI